MTLLLSVLSRDGSAQLFHKKAEVGPPRLTDVARKIDHIQSSILNQGTVVIKQPDIWSEARMTMFRKEFEDEMAKELANFRPLLAARIARSDAAALQSQTLLGASLTPLNPNQTLQLANPSDVFAERNAAVTLLNGSITTATASGGSTTTTLPAVPGALPTGTTAGAPVQGFQLLTATAPVANQASSTGAVTASALQLGLEPNVQLDQEADYITHLHRLRRVNLGDDNADSAGYGLYLMRVPVSIQPGDRTVKGHGAIVNITMRHDFAPGFLASTYRNLVINDVIDKLGAPIQELIRGGAAASYNSAESDLPGLVASANTVRDRLVKTHARLNLETRLPKIELRRSNLTLSNLRATAGEIGELLAVIDKIRSEAESGLTQLAALPPTTWDGDTASKIQEVAREVLSVRSSPLNEAQSKLSYANETLSTIRYPQERNSTAERQNPRNQPSELLQVTTDQTGFLRDVATDLKPSLDELSKAVEPIQEALVVLRSVGVNLPISRTGSRINAVAPTDVPRVFIQENLLRLAYSAQVALDLGRSSRNATWEIRLTDVRSYLRHQLEAAYDIVEGIDRSRPAVLMDVSYMESLTDKVAAREFEGPKGVADDPVEDDNDFEVVYKGFTDRLPGNLRERPLGALAWAIAIEAGLLNRQLRDDMKETKGSEGFTCPPNLEDYYFYTPVPLPEAEQIFQEYIRARWPMITFALEPVTDQQNIEDAFTRRRDLQLAVAFALSSGRISFRQAIQFTRQLQYEAQTIALNQTVSAFAHSNDTFGWRFTPRYQTPPEESNPLAIANLLTRGGPGPNYQIRNSKLEPGLRELTAVVVMPSFVRGMRLDVSTDWFPLHDPDERKIRTAHTVELGHRINEARRELAAAQSCGLYRPEDVERLGVRLLQLERMLPMQTAHVKVPYENTLGGFALFTQGVTALVPELTGFEGVEYLNNDQGADILVNGKHFSIYEMEVVVGNKSLTREKSSTEAASGQGSGGGTPAATGSFNVVSREVMRVKIPAKVTTATREDGQTVVEMYVSTPNGISNRLRIPVGPPVVAAASRPAPPVFSGASTTSTYTFVDSELKVSFDAYVENNVVVANSLRRFPADTRLRIQPTGRSQALYDAINLRVTFAVPGRANTVAPPIDLLNVPRQDDFYFLQAGHLDQIANGLQQMLKTSAIPVPTEVSAASVLVTPVPNPTDTTPPPTSRTSNPLRITFEYVLGPKPTTTAVAATPEALGAPAAAVALSPTPSEPPALPIVRFASPEPADPMVRPTALEQPPAQISPAAFQQGGGGAGLPVQPTAPASTATPPTPTRIQVDLNLPPLPPAGVPGVTPGTSANPPASQSSQTLLVVPQRAPSINLSVPITNQPSQRHGLFHREPISPANPARRPLLERLRGRF